MANTVGQWEVVGKSKPTKQANGKAGKPSKEQQKKLIENFPKLEDLPGLRESQTLFEAFNAKKSKQDSSKKQDKSNKSPSASANKKKPTDRKKQNEKPHIYSSLKEAFNCLDSEEEIQNLVDTAIARFPENPSIWLKDLAAYLNLKLACHNEHEDPTFSNQAPGYPLNAAPKFLRSILTTASQKCPIYTIVNFYEYCVNALADNIMQNVPANGYRLFLQCLGQEKHFITANLLDKLVALSNKYVNRTKICLSIMWAAGQIGLKNFKEGLKVWLDLMYPLISLKNYSKYVIDYLTALFDKYSNIKVGSDVVGITEFFSILDFTFSSSHSPQLHKQLRELYPNIREASFGKNPESNLHQFFPHFLQRLERNPSKVFKKELLNSIMMCLEIDRRTFSTWRQIYTRHIHETSVTLEHISSNWKTLSATLPLPMIKETLSAFHVTNTELGSKNDNIKRCNLRIEVLLKKMNETRFPYKLLFFAILLSLGGLLAYDIQTSGDLKKSKIGGFLKETGLLVVLQQAWSKITLYTDIAAKWTHKNVPVYAKTLGDTVKPYLVLGSTKLWEATVFVVEYTADARAFISLTAQNALIWVDKQAPGIIEKITEMSRIGIKNLWEYADIAWKYLYHYFVIISSWIQSNLLSKEFDMGILQNSLTSSLANVQDVMIQGYSWFAMQIKSVTG